MSTRPLGFAAALVFLALAALHVYWALGGRAGGGAAVPTKNGAQLFHPSRGATWVVAFLLSAAAATVLGRVGVLGTSLPPWFFRAGTSVLALVFLARAVGDFGWIGFFKRHRGTPFAKLDDALYSPLSLALAIGCAVLAAGTP